jgi:hypothetical protein
MATQIRTAIERRIGTDVFRARDGGAVNHRRCYSEAMVKPAQPIYAAHGVGHVWLIDPIGKTLEVHTLGADRRWREVRMYEGDR